MSQKIKQATPIIKSYLKRHPVPLSVFDAVFQTLRISLWKSIKKHESTHQDWELVHLFEYQARSDLKAEYFIEPMIRIPAKRIYDKQWQAENMPVVLHYDDKPDDCAIQDIFSNNELPPTSAAELSQLFEQLTSKEQLIVTGRMNGQTFKHIGQSMGLKSEIMPLQIMAGIRVKLGLAQPTVKKEHPTVTARKQRNAKILKLREDGLSQNQIAKALNIPRTTVANVTACQTQH